jgi:hypothetical protein
VSVGLIATLRIIEPAMLATESKRQIHEQEMATRYDDVAVDRELAISLSPASQALNHFLIVNPMLTHGARCCRLIHRLSELLRSSRFNVEGE